MADPLLKHFFSSQSFAVVGASTNPAKFGYKVLKWYKDRSLSVTPINPKEPKILDIETKTSLSQVSEPKNVSVSVITPPAVSLQVVKEASKLGIPALWFQPGSYNAEVLKEADNNGIKYLAHERCILVEGDHGLSLRSSL